VCLCLCRGAVCVCVYRGGDAHEDHRNNRVAAGWLLSNHGLSTKISPPRPGPAHSDHLDDVWAVSMVGMVDTVCHAMCDKDTDDLSL